MSALIWLLLIPTYSLRRRRPTSQNTALRLRSANAQAPGRRLQWKAGPCGPDGQRPAETFRRHRRHAVQQKGGKRSCRALPALGEWTLRRASPRAHRPHRFGGIALAPPASACARRQRPVRRYRHAKFEMPCLLERGRWRPAHFPRGFEDQSRSPSRLTRAVTSTIAGAMTTRLGHCCRPRRGRHGAGFDRAAADQPRASSAEGGSDQDRMRSAFGLQRSCVGDSWRV